MIDVTQLQYLCVCLSLQIEETMNDDKILIDNHLHSMCNCMDRSEIIVRMEIGLENGHGKTDDVDLGSPRNNGVDKVNKLFYHEVSQMGATCFPELCFTAAKYSSGNSMVVITQPTLIIHPPFDYM